MWRAFVYNADVDPDRVKRAYLEFVPLDGKFRDNVFVQVKNGPLDFQPREPFHPLFGALKTPVMTELQITQEYFGHSTHLVYLAPLWREFFDADTFTKGPGSPVSKVVDGSLTGERRTGIAGVANTGSDRNWTGHHLAQANWYAFGRLAWNPDAGAADIADDWIRMTWGHDPAGRADAARAAAGLVRDVRRLHDAAGAAPPDRRRPLRADAGEPRSAARRLVGDLLPPRRFASASASTARRRAATTSASTARRCASAGRRPPTTPENLLLWFHRVPWDYKLSNGRTLWQGLVDHYTRGADQARGFVARWQTLKGKVDDARYAAVLAKLEQQAADAAAWRDKCLTYFQQFSKRPIGQQH